MRLFVCPGCKLPVFFSNVKCERCEVALGYDPIPNAMRALHILTTSLDFDVYDPKLEMTTLTDAWVALASALNSFNRSMGTPDPYPFVLSPKANEKLAFVHALVHAAR